MNELSPTNQFSQDVILSQLNDSQRQAVVYTDGPQLVIAGAGSGKTRVLTYKIAYLLTQGLQPWDILALTFTNKAAREMKERIAQIVGSERAKYLFMGTFHSVFARILRSEASVLGYQSNFTIYDDADSRSLIKAIIKELGLDEKIYSPATICSQISTAKNHLVLSSEYASMPDFKERDKRNRTPEVYRIYQAYQQRCLQSNAMDFDDLLMNTFLLFRDHDDIRQKYAQKFKYILVDEYQDTNKVQVSIVQQLAQGNQHVCVVGDDYQSIYSFRGANIDNILSFQKRFPKTRLCKLERNYRSTQNIVNAANSLMKHNRRQINKTVYSEESQGELLTYYPCYSDKEESILVVNKIAKIHQKTQCAYDSFVILYRTNAQSRSFEGELRKNNIPYRIYGGLSFYQRKEIKDSLAYLRLAVNPEDSEALRRIINYPTRGIGNTTQQKLWDAAASNGVNLWTIVNNPSMYGVTLAKSTLNKLLEFQNMIVAFQQMAEAKDAFDVCQTIIKASGIERDLQQHSDADSLAKQENIEEFLASVHAFVEEQREENNKEFVRISDFMQEVSLLTDQDIQRDDEPKVTLMTVHASKGLEFPYVFVAGLEENIFPSSQSVESVNQLEEERRLLYVAITRAQSQCFLTSAKNRFRYGQTQFDPPSRFIDEIDHRYLEIIDEAKGFQTAESYRRPWQQTDYEPNRPYRAMKGWGNEDNQRGRWQNSRPVASQFRADPKPKITRMKAPERAVEALPDSFKQELIREGGNIQKLQQAQASGGRALGISEGAIVEHSRFGVGTVMRIEGQGEQAKATVAFRHVGTKQLLLKFAKLTVLNGKQ